MPSFRRSRASASLFVVLSALSILVAFGASAGCGSCEGSDASPTQTSSPQGASAAPGARTPRSMPLPPTMIATPDASWFLCPSRWMDRNRSAPNSLASAVRSRSESADGWFGPRVR